MPRSRLPVFCACLKTIWSLVNSLRHESLEGENIQLLRFGWSMFLLWSSSLRISLWPHFPNLILHIRHNVLVSFLDFPQFLVCLFFTIQLLPSIAYHGFLIFLSSIFIFSRLMTLKICVTLPFVSCSLALYQVICYVLHLVGMVLSWTLLCATFFKAAAVLFSRCGLCIRWLTCHHFYCFKCSRQVFLAAQVLFHVPVAVTPGRALSCSRHSSLLDRSSTQGVKRGLLSHLI